MTAIDHRPPNSTASNVLISVGIILVLSFFLDFVVRLSSSQLSNPEWQLNLMNELIDRGVIPLIGLALVYAGFWIQKSAKQAAAQSNPAPSTTAAAWQDPKFWTFVFASLLGLVFLLMIPLHFGKVGELLKQTLDQVDQQAIQTEQLIQQEQQQFQAAAQSGQLDQLLKNNQLPANQRAVLEQLKQDPKALDKRVEERLAEVKQQKEEATERANNEGFITRLRVELRSVLLAIGFVIIGWTGLRDSES